MSNLTISTNAEILKKARIRALSEGTSVNAVLSEFLESYSGVRLERSTAISDILLISKNSRARRGGSAYSREELHER